MRIVVLLIALLFPSAAFAQYWDHYANDRFGYAIDIPPDFVGNGENDSRDGQSFYNLEAEQGLSVWSGPLQTGFEAEAAERISLETGQNWQLIEQATTPTWARFSAQRDHRIFSFYMIPLCDGATFAAFRAEYNIRDRVKFDPIMEGLVRSFQPTGC